MLAHFSFGSQQKCYKEVAVYASTSCFADGSKHLFKVSKFPRPTQEPVKKYEAVAASKQSCKKPGEVHVERKRSFSETGMTFINRDTLGRNFAIFLQGRQPGKLLAWNIIRENIQPKLVRNYEFSMRNCSKILS